MANDKTATIDAVALAQAITAGILATQPKKDVSFEEYHVRLAAKIRSDSWSGTYSSMGERLIFPAARKQRSNAATRFSRVLLQ